MIHFVFIMISFSHLNRDTSANAVSLKCILIFKCSNVLEPTTIRHTDIYIYILPPPFLGLYHGMEISRLGVKLQLHLPAYATATATPEPSLFCDLHHSSQQHRILNLLSWARDQTCILMETSQVHNLLSHSRNFQTVIF